MRVGTWFPSVQIAGEVTRGRSRTWSQNNVKQLRETTDFISRHTQDQFVSSESIIRAHSAHTFHVFFHSTIKHQINKVTHKMSISTLGTDYSDDDHAMGMHADLSYDDVVAAGPPARPLDFPAPTVLRCKTVDVHAKDHRSGTIHFLRNVIVRTDDAEHAYFVTKKLGKTVYGSIRLGIVLRRRERSPSSKAEERQDTQTPEIEWESTDLQAAIKISEFSKIHAMRGRHLEDPIKEISAMQLLGNYHPHVLGAMEVLQDDNYLYAITRHLSGGELYGRIMEAFPQKRQPEQINGTDNFSYDESKARTWFKQLILVSCAQAQTKGE